MSASNGGKVLAIDVGTGKVKAAVAARGGRLLSTSSAPAPYRPNADDVPLGRDFDPASLWAAIVDTTRRAMRKARATGGGIAVIAVTSQRQGIGALDAEGSDLFLGPNMDLRALFEGMAIDGDHPDLVYPVTGHLPSFMLAHAKLRWRQLHDPEVYESIASVVTVADWVGHRLTGELALQETLAAEAGLLDVANGGLAAQLFETLGLRTDCFPPITKLGTKLGGLCAAAAGELGLASGVPVVVAGPDTQCGLLAMGAASPGQSGVVAGWSVTSQAITDTPRLDARRRTWAGRHVVPGRWVAEANAGDGGNAYQWLTELLVGEEARGFERMEALAAQAPPGSEGALALLGPAPLDLSRTGLRPGGLLFPVPVTFGGLDRARLARAALENVAYAVRGSVELLSEVTGAAPDALAVGGGMTHTSLFTQVLADVLGRPVHVAAVPDVSLQGAAMAAEAALEGGDALAQLAQSARDGLQKATPDPADSHEYQEHYARWLDAQSRLEGFL